MSYEMIAIFMFASMMLMLTTGQRVFGAIGAVASLAAVLLYGTGGVDIPFSAAMKLMSRTSFGSTGISFATLRARGRATGSSRCGVTNPAISPRMNATMS